MIPRINTSGIQPLTGSNISPVPRLNLTRVPQPIQTSTIPTFNSPRSARTVSSSETSTRSQFYNKSASVSSISNSALLSPRYSRNISSSDEKIGLLKQKFQNQKKGSKKRKSIPQSVVTDETPSRSTQLSTSTPISSPRTTLPEPNPVYVTSSTNYSSTGN